jgi:catechol 2,3-dioxygenase-like lactoylglutathione lyase family enzyme
MKRMHVMLRVRDLEESLRFYTELFGAAPTVRKSDYAKWMLEDPRVNFSIGEKGDGLGIEHLGIQAETSEELAELRERIGRAGGTVENEGETTCCYASSDKTWVVDAQGVAWEAFHTHGEAATYSAPAPGVDADARGARCCGPECCDEEVAPAAGLVAAGACC